MVRPKIDPILAATLGGLVVFVLAFWGYTSRFENGHPVGKVGRTRARLNDGMCVFSANVELEGSLGKVEFNRHRLEIRDALVGVLRRKSSYMIDSPVSREALRSQMVREVNRVAQKRIALGLQFSEFDLF